MKALAVVGLLLLALYIAGCVAAYHAIQSDRSEYTRLEVVKYTLGSWATVVIGLLGRVQ